MVSPDGICEKQEDSTSTLESVVKVGLWQITQITPECICQRDLWKTIISQILDSGLEHIGSYWNSSKPDGEMSIGHNLDYLFVL